MLYILTCFIRGLIESLSVPSQKNLTSLNSVPRLIILGTIYHSSAQVGMFPDLDS